MSTLMNSSTHKHIVFVVYTKEKVGLYQNEFPSGNAKILISD